MAWLKELLDWLKTNLPGLWAAFRIGFSMGADGKKQITVKLEKAELELKLKENEKKNDEEFAGKSADDIIDSIITRRGRE